MEEKSNWLIIMQYAMIKELYKNGYVRYVLASVENIKKVKSDKDYKPVSVDGHTIDQIKWMLALYGAVAVQQTIEVKLPYNFYETL